MAASRRLAELAEAKLAELEQNGDFRAAQFDVTGQSERNQLQNGGVWLHRQLSLVQENAMRTVS